MACVALCAGALLLVVLCDCWRVCAAEIRQTVAGIGKPSFSCFLFACSNLHIHTECLNAQVHTCSLLVDRYAAMGRAEDSASKKLELEEKSAELQETHDAAVAKV